MAGLNGAEEELDDGLINLDFNRICRLCLNFCRDFVDLRPSIGTQNAPRHIVEQIKYCYSIKIDLTEPLPSKICLQCIQILTLLSATKRNIKYSEMMLKNILSIRNAHRMINAQNRGRGLNLSFLQKRSSDNHQKEQEPPVEEDTVTEDNISITQDNISHTQDSPLQNIRINPIQLTTMEELYKIQDQVLGKNNQNIPENSNVNTEEHTVNKTKEKTRRKSGNSKVALNKTPEIKSNILKSVEIKQDVSNNANSNSVKPSSSRCSTSSDSASTEKTVSKTTKTVGGNKKKNTNRKSNVVNNMNNKKTFEIDMRRELKVKLEILDLKNIKYFCPPSTDGPSRSTEGQGGGTSRESKSGKVVKEIGTVIDESNILSPKVKRMRKSIPKG